MGTDPYLGEVTMFAGNFAPRGWAFCNGALLPIASNSALFSLLGTMYGGDGRTTFGLPDFRGRFAMGVGTGPGLPPNRQGELGGAPDRVITVSEMPNHGHSPKLHAEQAGATNNVPFNRMLGVSPAGTDIYAEVAAADDIQMAPQSITESNVGGGQPLNVMNPFQTINFIIALQGVFPSRS